MAKKIDLIGAMYPWNESVESLIKVLADDTNGDLEISINSPGGMVTLGIDLFNRVRRYPGNIKMIITGMAASMATYFALAGDEVVVEDNSIFMIHNASGYAYGDYKEMLKFGNLLDSMTNLIALKYVEKTGKDMVDIRAKMDDELYLFGQEIKDFGFADRVIETKKDKDKKKAQAEAMIEITSCLEEMKKHEISDSDMNKIAAHLSTEVKTPHTEAPKTPENKGNNNQTEVKSMSLKELMAKDPGIKAEVEALVNEAKTQGFTDGKAEITARITAAEAYVGKTEYPEAVTNLAVQVLKGEKDPAALEGAVVAFDAMKQANATAAAAGETEEQGETPGEQPEGVTEGGEVKNEADYDASLEKIKKAQGRGGK